MSVTFVQRWRTYTLLDQNEGYCTGGNSDRYPRATITRMFTRRFTSGDSLLLYKTCRRHQFSSMKVWVLGERMCRHHRLLSIKPSKNFSPCRIILVFPPLANRTYHTSTITNSVAWDRKIFHIKTLNFFYRVKLK